MCARQRRCHLCWGCGHDHDDDDDDRQRRLANIGFVKMSSISTTDILLHMRCEARATFCRNGTSGRANTMFCYTRWTQGVKFDVESILRGLQFRCVKRCVPKDVMTLSSQKCVQMCVCVRVCNRIAAPLFVIMARVVGKRKPRTFEEGAFEFSTCELKYSRNCHTPSCHKSGM